MSERQNFRAVCFWDPAIVVAESDLEAYATTRNLAHLKFREGLRPMTFILRPLSNRIAIDHILSQDNLVVRRRLAFQMSVVEVENARLEDGREAPGMRWIPSFLASLGGTPIPKEVSTLVSDAELDLFDPATILDIGEVAHARTFLPRGIEGGYALPGTSRRLLRAMRDLYAAFDPTNSDRRQPPTDSPPSEPMPDDSTRSDELGAATATASVTDSPGESETPESSATPEPSD